MNRPPPNEWPKVTRVVRCGMGRVIVNEIESDVCNVFVGRLAPIAAFKIPTFASLFGFCNAFGYEPVGVEFIDRAEVADGLAPSDWRVFSSKTGWPGTDLRYWASEAANAAIELSAMELWDIHSRIRTQSEICQQRMLDVHVAFERALAGKAAQQTDLKEHALYSDGWLDRVVLSVQSCLTDLCTMRDYYCELVSFHRQALGNSKYPGNTGSSFIKRFKNCDDDTLVDRLLSFLGTADETQFGSASLIRDQIVHRAPLSSSGLLSWMNTRVELKNEIRVPGVEARISRSILKNLIGQKQHLPANKDEYIKSVSENLDEIRNPDKSIDALSLCRMHTINLFEHMIATYEYLKIPRMPIVIRGSDIVSINRSN